MNTPGDPVRRLADFLDAHHMYLIEWTMDHLKVAVPFGEKQMVDVTIAAPHGMVPYELLARLDSNPSGV